MKIKLSRKVRQKVRAYLAAQDAIDVQCVILGPMWRGTVVSELEAEIAERDKAVCEQTQAQAYYSLARLMGSFEGADLAINQVIQERIRRRGIEYAKEQGLDPAELGFI